MKAKIRALLAQKHIDNGELGAIYRMFGDAMNKVGLPIILISTLTQNYATYFWKYMDFYQFVGLSVISGSILIIFCHKYLYQSTVMDSIKQGMQRNPLYEKQDIIIEQNKEIIALLKR